ncbi:sulfite exporter TauE/SafE family protein [Pseudomonas mandelii]|uniref:sulfite exporter TauE/SafE family protein n=1 Tax=Pseudomonas mandelii TaxID=75612 RepID=UPI00224A76CE|nr:sulfite exporter TauE/SafE family protein [Pseudomonas mandelii]MCX2900984.1 sulfite exporter TauE/SafE family protein [Pseudomonas mandelii]
MLSVWSHVGFLLCVALATFAQNTTGFAFGLLLLGLTGLLQLAPVETVANVSSILTLINAFVLLRRRPALAPKLLAVILGCSLLGVVVGVELLGALGAHERDLLQLVLGSTIVLCSFLLVVQSRHLQQLSGWLSFSGFAGLSGVMGGLFSSAGPPLVYQLYRQPLAAQVVRDTLIVVFALNALLRLGLQGYTGRFEPQAGYLALEAAPVVFALTWYMRRRPPAIKAHTLRMGVFVLLLLAGASLVVRPLLSLHQ